MICLVRSASVVINSMAAKVCLTTEDGKKVLSSIASIFTNKSSSSFCHPWPPFVLLACPSHLVLVFFLSFLFFLLGLDIQGNEELDSASASITSRDSSTNVVAAPAGLKTDEANWWSSFDSKGWSKVPLARPSCLFSFSFSRCLCLFLLLFFLVLSPCLCSC